MMHIKKSFLKGNTKFIFIACIWLLASEQTNLVAQNCHQDNKSEYPYLWNILELYCYYNLSVPKNIDELIKFADLSEPVYSNYIHYKTLKEITLSKIINSKDKLRIVKNGCEYDLILGDTLLYSYDRFPCCDLVDSYYPEEQPLIMQKRIEENFLFFKNETPVLERTQLISALLSKLKMVYAKHSTNKGKIIFLRYLSGDSLFDYCQIGENIDNHYYNEIKECLNQFCSDYEIDEIFLYAYCVE